VRPNDPNVYMQLAGFYNSQGDFDKTIAMVNERTKVEPNNPEAFQTLATYYWDKAYRDFRLSDKDKLQYVMSGIEAVDKAIQIKADYMEAIAYKNLLLRLQANLEKDPAKQQALLREADQLRDRAEELRKQKASGTS
jgi:tetratricopeptide (TPR) repeat protein